MLGGETMKTPPLLRRTVVLVGCALMLGLVGCGTTGAAEKAASAEDPAAAAKKMRQARWEAAKTAVNNVFNALRQRDEDTFKSYLSADRLANYTRAYYELWVRETDDGSGHRAYSLETGDTPDHARVIVAFRSGRNTERVAVRLVKENGSWRWDEK